MAGSEVFIKFISCDYVPTLFCKAEILQGEIWCRLRLIACKQALLGALGSGEKNSFSSDPPPLTPSAPLVVLCSTKGERSPGQLGQEGYGKRKRKGQEVEFLKGREAEEIWGNYPTMLNISQSKKGWNEEAKKTGAGDRRFGPPPYSRVSLIILSLNSTYWLYFQCNQICYAVLCLFSYVAASRNTSNTG